MDSGSVLRQLHDFPSYEEYQAARVFPLVEKINFFGVVSGLLTLAASLAFPALLGADGAFYGMLVLSMGLALGAILICRVSWNPILRMVLVVCLSSTLQILLVSDFLFLRHDVVTIPAILSFFLFSFLPLAPLISAPRLVALNFGMLGQTAVLALIAQTIGVARWDQLLPVFGFLGFALLMVSLLAHWNRQQALAHYALARGDQVHLHIDGLAQVLNRRSWMDKAERGLLRCRETGQPSAVVMGDIDHFKKINDTQGHPMGDQVIQKVGRALVELTRDGDLVGRIGGEEFAVFLAGSGPEAARQIAERIRAGIEGLPPMAPWPVTLSLGVVDAGAEPVALSVLLAQADRRLYAAKAAGRNQVVGTDESSVR